MRQRTSAVLMLMATVLLTGCLFTLNDPLAAPDGTIAVFLDANGGYTLFPETGGLHLFRDDEWIPIPAATIAGSGGLLDLSPDGSQALYVDIDSDGVFTSFASTLYRCALLPDAAPERILQTGSTVAKAEWVRSDRILVLLFDEQELGTLHALDPTTRKTTLLAEDLLSFEVVPETDELLLLAARPESDPPLGGVVRWDPETGTRRPLATFVLSEETLESFAALPHRLFWDVSPDGTWVALALYDGTVVVPAAETELPTLYLIDLMVGETQRIAVEALMPAFAPDGSGLLYAVEAESDEAVLMWRSFASGRSTEVPGSVGMSTAFWLSPTTLGMTYEMDEDRFRLVSLDVDTEEIRVLVDAPARSDE